MSCGQAEQVRAYREAPMHEQETVEIIYGVNPVKEALRGGHAH